MGPQLNLAAYEDALRQQAQLFAECLDEFEAHLATSGVPTRQADDDMRDVRTFLYEYLLHEDDNDLEMGCYLADDYFEEYVIEQCAWATPEAVEHAAKSLTRFYECMLLTGHVDEDACEELEATVEAQLSSWTQAAAQKAAVGEQAGAGRPSPTQIRDAVAQGLGQVRRQEATPEPASPSSAAAPLTELEQAALRLALLAAEAHTTPEAALEAALQSLRNKGVLGSES